MTAQLQGWPEPYIYGEYTIILAGKSPNIQSYTVYIYGSGQPYVYGIYDRKVTKHTVKNRIRIQTPFPRVLRLI